MNRETQLYRKFMEDLLERRIDLYSKRIRYNDRAYPDTEIYKRYNELYDSLSAENKMALADIIQETRDSAIFDVLEFLDDKINRENLKIIQDNVEFPNSFFGGNFHCDWAALCQGDMWGNNT